MLAATGNPIRRPNSDDKKPRTLTRLYNDRPTWLDLAHRTLDAAVCAAYGWPIRQAQGEPADMTDEQTLERLLTLNVSRSTASAVAPL